MGLQSVPGLSSLHSSLGTSKEIDFLVGIRNKLGYDLSPTKNLQYVTILDNIHSTLIKSRNRDTHFRTWTTKLNSLIKKYKRETIELGQSNMTDEEIKRIKARIFENLYNSLHADMPKCIKYIPGVKSFIGKVLKLDIEPMPRASSGKLQPPKAAPNTLPQESESAKDISSLHRDKTVYRDPSSEDVGGDDDVSMNSIHVIKNDRSREAKSGELTLRSH